MTSILCTGCGAPADAPSVAEELQEITGKQPLCLECMEKKLGRGLRSVDLQEVSSNRVLLALLARAKTADALILKTIGQALDTYHLAIIAKENTGKAQERLVLALEQLLERPFHGPTMRGTDIFEASSKDTD